MKRRGFLSMLGGLAFAGRAGAQTATGPALGEPQSFSADLLLAEAEALAQRPYRPRRLVPDEWIELSYDEYRAIWFKTDQALWQDTGGPLRVDLLQPGLYYTRPTQINVVTGTTAREVLFDLALFDRTDQVPDLPGGPGLGYSGFRIRAETEKAGIHQEFLVFQGASYFRAIGNGQTYGLSARGLALNTADPAGEEFPDFSRFWIETPAVGATNFVVHALLDGASATGAYRFDITPGATTVVNVTATLFVRTALGNVGLAPLTSMFLFDETNRARFDDYRAGVHDSDGLLIRNGAGETLWRPLANPRDLQISAFLDDGPQGFGLMQRSRAFSDFADLEAHYQDRPSLWITPEGDWGKGAVTLVEIPTNREFYDNIVAYWRPEVPITPGTPLRFSYRMDWGVEPALPSDIVRITNTRLGGTYSGGHVATVDFADHSAVPGNLDLVTVRLTVSAGQIKGTALQRNPDTGGARLAISFDPAGAQVVEMRAALELDGAVISEVWLYRWTA